MSQEEPVQRKKGRLARIMVSLVRVAIALVIFFVVAGVVSGILLATGWPQRKAVVFGLTRVFQSEIQLGSMSTKGGVIKIDDLKIFKTPGTKPSYDIRGIDLEYVLYPKDYRYFPKMTVQSASLNLGQLAVEPIASSEAVFLSAFAIRRNVVYDRFFNTDDHFGRHFFATLAEQGGNLRDFVMESIPRRIEYAAGKISGALPRPRMEPLDFVPRDSQINVIKLYAARPTLGLEIGDLQCKAAVGNFKNYSIDLSGQDLSGAWWAGSSGDRHPIADGALNLQFQNKDREYVIDTLAMSIPDSLAVQVTGKYKDKSKELDLNVETLIATNIDLSEASELPVPFRFAKLDLSGSRIKAGVDTKAFKLLIPDAQLNLDVESLALGPKGNEYYEGDLSIRAASVPGADLKIVGDATLDAGQKIHGVLKGIPMGLVFRAKLEDWSREETLAALPKALRASLETVPTFREIASGSFETKLEVVNLTMKGDMKPVFAASGYEPQTLDLSFTYITSVLVLSRGLRGTGHASVRLGNSSINVESSFSPKNRFDGKFSVSQVNPNTWLSGISGSDALALLDTIITGTFDLKSGESMESFNVVLDLSANPFRYGPVVLSPVKTLNVKGTLACSNMPLGSITAPEITVTAGKNNNLVVSDLSVDLEAMKAKADVKGDVDLALLSGLLSGATGAPSANLTGLAKTEFRVRYDGDTGLQVFQLTLDSDKDVTIDAAFLKSVLEAQNKQQEAEIVGTEGSRAFDSAKLSLRIESGRLVGEMALASSDLKLTIPIGG